MEDKKAFVCRHNPCKSHNWLNRFWRFFFHRKESLNSFCCEACGTPLQIPKMNLFHRVGYFWFSILITYILFRLIKSGVISVLLVIIVCLLYLILLVVYRINSSLTLAIGSWRSLEGDRSYHTREKELKDQGRLFSTIAAAGILVCVACVQETYIAFYILIASFVLMMINYKIRKKWLIGIIALNSFSLVW